MKSIIPTILLALVSVTSLAQKQVVWDKPAAILDNTQFEITKVELKQTETVLHVTVNYIPHYWIRFNKNSYLQTPDGKRYTITNGLKTNEKEADLLLDSLFWMPESGTANLALHFNPVPENTNEFDFSEGDEESAFRFWNICDRKSKRKIVLPTDWKSVKYAKDEVLPVAKINKGIATIYVKMLDYKPNMKMELYVGGFTPLASEERFEKFFPFADDGTLKVEVPLWLTREVTIGIQGMAFSHILVAPGEETHILMKVTGDNKPFIAFKGYMAKTNMDMVKAHETIEKFWSGDMVYSKVKNCKTKEERLKCLQDIFNQRVAIAQKSKFTTAAKELFCMEAEKDYVAWTRDFTFKYSQYLEDEDGDILKSLKNFSEKMVENKDMLTLSEAEQAYSWKYLNEPTSPCSQVFWDAPIAAYDKQAAEKNVYNNELKYIQSVMRGGDGNLANLLLKTMKYEDCKGIIREYQAKQKRIAEELARKENVFKETLNDVAPENILPTILSKYKGKAVLIDVWATWCGPCKAGHKIMAPWKKELKDKNIQFVYITSPSSPLTTWQKMITDIDGDHYYLTQEQYNYILNHYESDGIPTYAIYDAEGKRTFKTIGFSGLDVFKNEVEKVLK